MATILLEDPVSEGRETARLSTTALEVHKNGKRMCDFICL
jgi:hypothetical protein